MPDSRSGMHTHFSAMVIGGTFVGVLFAGTLWKLSAAHLIASSNPTLQQLGKGMLFQYG